MTLEAAYERKENRNIFRLPRDVAPIQAAVLPLVTKDGLPEKATEIHRTLLDTGFVASYDESGSIGRRYARSDEIGTPLAVTIDYDTLEKHTVTIRDRDSWTQVLLPAQDLAGKLRQYYDGIIEFDGIGDPV
jgi:glycyl-tRNA synthetase